MTVSRCWLLAVCIVVVAGCDTTPVGQTADEELGDPFIVDQPRGPQPRSYEFLGTADKTDDAAFAEVNSAVCLGGRAIQRGIITFTNKARFAFHLVSIPYENQGLTTRDTTSIAGTYTMHGPLVHLSAEDGRFWLGVRGPDLENPTLFRFSEIPLSSTRSPLTRCQLLFGDVSVPRDLSLEPSSTAEQATYTFRDDRLPYEFRLYKQIWRYDSAKVELFDNDRYLFTLGRRYELVSNSRITGYAVDSIYGSYRRDENIIAFNTDTAQLVYGTTEGDTLVVYYDNWFRPMRMSVITHYHHAD